MKLLRKYIRELIQEVVIESTSTVQPETVIYCDMDGVLVNFETGAVSLLNSILDNETSLDTGSKKYQKTLRRVQRDLGPEWRAINRADLNLKPVRNFMFAVISGDPGGFFSSLAPLPDGVGELWPFINSTGHTVKLLTAGVTGNPEMPTAEEGKRMWAMENLRPRPSEVILSPAAQKPGFAVSDGIPNILIDDKVSTINGWNQRGGIGILHVPGGSSATIARLQKMLNMSLPREYV
jgi:hypothetical protein